MPHLAGSATGRRNCRCNKKWLVCLLLHILRELQHTCAACKPRGREVRAGGRALACKAGGGGWSGEAAAV